MIISNRVTRASAANLGSNLFCYRESSTHRSSAGGGRMGLGDGGSYVIAAQTWFSVVRLRRDARPRARTHRDDVSADDLAGDSGHQGDFGEMVKPRPGRSRDRRATSILGPLRAPPKGMRTAPRLPASPSGAQRIGQPSAGSRRRHAGSNAADIGKRVRATRLLLPTAYCLLSTVYCLLPSAFQTFS